MKGLKRAFSISLMVVTVLSMSLITAPAKAADSAESGDLIKIEGYSPVYYLGADGQRYVFPDEATYFSWYKDFSSVVTLPQEEVESYDLASNVTMRPGTNLVKRPVPTDPNVYAVTPNAELVLIPDEETAETLYGENWTDRVVDVPDSFFVDYEKTGTEAGIDSYPAGTLVQPYGASDVYYINEEGKAQLIDDEADFEANRFQWDYITEAAEGYELPEEGETITGAVSDIIDTSQGGGSGDTSQEGVGSGLTVALSSNTPASDTIPQGASGVEFATYNLTASNDGDVTLDHLTLTRKGVGSAGDFDKVYLYQDGTRLTTGRTVNSSDNTVMFTSVGLEVSAGQTETLTVVADIDSGGNGNNAFAIQEAGDIELSGETSVSGSFPVTGNTMSISTGGTAANLTVESLNDTTEVNKKIGQDDQEIAHIDLTNDNEEDVELQSLTLTNGGNATADNLGNLALYHLGSKVAEGTLSNNQLSFDLDEGLTIEKGDNIELKAKADIESGVNNTVKLYLGYAADIVAVGQSYGYNASISFDSFNSSSDSYPIIIQGSEINVNYATNNNETVSKDQNNFVFETLEVTTKEEVTVSEMQLTVAEGQGTGTGTKDIDNLEIRNPATGEIISGSLAGGEGDNNTADVDWKFESFTWDGSSEWEIRGDIPSNADHGDTYQVNLDLSSNFVARYTASNNEVDSASDLSETEFNGSTYTIGDSTLTVTAASFNNGEAVANTDDVVIAGGLLDANSVSAINVKSMEFEGASSGLENGDATDAKYLASNNVSSLKLMIDNEVVDTVSSGSMTDGEVVFEDFDAEVPADGSAEFQVLLNVSGTLDASTTVRVQLRSVTAKDANNDDATIVENGESSSISDTATVDFARVVELYESGALNLTMDNTVDPVDNTQYILGGTQGNKVARFKLKADYEDMKITKLVAYTPSGIPARSVSGANITDESGNVLASDVMISTGATTSATSSVTFNSDAGLFDVAEGTHYYYLTLDLKNLGDGATETAASGDAFTMRIMDLEAQGDSGNDITYTGSADDVTYGSGSDRSAVANEAKVVGVQITSVTDQTSSDFSQGEATVFKFDVTTASGDNASSSGDLLKAALEGLKVKFSYSSGTATGSAVKLYRQGKTGYATTSLPASGDEANFNLVTAATNGTGWAASNYEIAQGDTATFYVKANLTDATSNDDYVQCSISDLNSDDFVWSDGVISRNDLRLNYSEVIGASVSQ